MEEFNNHDKAAICNAYIVVNATLQAITQSREEISMKAFITSYREAKNLLELELEHEDD